MIVHPSYVEMMQKVNESSETPDEVIVNSRYSIVMATSKRARQIIAAEKNDDVAKKALSMAVDEIMDDKVHILQEESDNYENYESDEDGKV